jgi:predicted CoA-binding protein
MTIGDCRLTIGSPTRRPISIVNRQSQSSLANRQSKSAILGRMENWRENIIDDTEKIRELLAATRTIAVLGIKTEAQSSQAAFYVPRYMSNAGFEIIPVPVYYPEVKQILGANVYRKLVDIPGEVDLVNVFRKSGDVPAHVDDILAKRPKAVWLQLGIRNDAVAETLAKAGIKVVQDRCLMVDHRYL